ncbi:hypothetical protein TNCT_614231 [Trichonephila clavata]|uniref:Uncharacterized protein n=1 Tax=Trichonephila clavata TaxID=2740835 RepID=A0A8X6FI35_TRICU|nr:hypothetical protein TNCT_614231 [Trichonephila clavata]
MQKVSYTFVLSGYRSFLKGWISLCLGCKVLLLSVTSFPEMPRQQNSLNCYLNAGFEALVNIFLVMGDLIRKLAN